MFTNSSARDLNMAGKRKGKRGRSRSADMAADEPHIGAALVPTAAFAAVPRTPPPPSSTATMVTMPPATLNSSLVGRIPLANPNDDEPFSDPESSLYDYQQMEEPGYSSVGFGTWPDRRSISDRERARTPSPGTSRGSGGREHDVDDFQRRSRGQPLYHELERDVNQNDIYAVPDKSKKKRSAVVDETFVKVQEGNLGTSMNGTTRDVRNAMQAVHDLPPELEGEGIVQMRRSRSQQSSPSMGRTSHRSSMRKETDTKIMNESEDAPITNEEAEPEIVEELIDKHVVANQRSLNPNGKVTMASGHLSTRLTMREKSDAVVAENMQLRDLLEQQNTELHTLRQVAEAVKEGDTENAASFIFRKQIEELKEDNEVLKETTHRLNLELSELQAKKDANFLSREAKNIKGLPSIGPVPSWLISKRYLAPLFVAYDDRIQEKEEIIRKYQEELSSLRKRTEEVVRENHKYHIGGGGPIGANEWQQVQEQAKLVLEENQILMEQIDVQQNKGKEMFTAHMNEVARLTKKLHQCEAEKIDLDRDLEETRLKYSELRHKHDQLLLTTGGQVAVQDHINTLADIKRTLVEEKEQHFQETERLMNKTKAVDEERKSLAVKNTDLVAENRRLHEEIKALHKAVRRAQHKLMVFQKHIEKSESKELSMQEYMAGFIKVAEKTAVERDTYAKVAKEQQTESKKAMNIVREEALIVGKLEEKLKLYKMKATAKLTTVADRLKEKDENFNSQKLEYEREIRYLRGMLHEKESRLQALNHDRKETELDLENMWQAANSENMRMKDTMRKSMRKLRQHDGLRDLVEDVDKQDLLNVSSDEEH